MPPRAAPKKTTKKTTAVRKTVRKPAASSAKMHKMATELKKAATALMHHSKQLRASK